MKDLIAWDGTSESFWLAVNRHTGNCHDEGDLAVLCEVLAFALEARIQEAKHQEAARAFAQVVTHLTDTINALRNAIRDE